MASTPWLAIVILVLLVALGIAAWKLSRGKKTPTDYYNLFVIGLLWLPIGIATKNYAFATVGLVFITIGLIHKKEWEKNRIACANLTEDEKRRNNMLAVAAFLIAALLAFYLAIRSRA